MLSQHKVNNSYYRNILCSCQRISFTAVYSRLISFNIPYNMLRDITVRIKTSSKTVGKNEPRFFYLFL